jgi:hypothetical protein
VRSRQLVVGAGDGADHHEGEPASVERLAWWDDGCERFDDLLGGLKGFGAAGSQEVLSGCQDSIFRDKDVLEKLISFSL